MDDAQYMYAIGIDLGTSNCALAVTPLDGDGVAETVPVAQLVSARTIDSRPTLPSALYLATEQEQRSLPSPGWQCSRADMVVGEWARNHGALSPQRLVTSAKSWLCNSSIDPTAPLLPWQSELEERKVSPLQAAEEYLRHLRYALLAHWRRQGVDADLSRCKVTITVPASFDEVARIFTADAAAAAGWGDAVLLEEQQAAFYHWLQVHADDWREQVQAGDVVLVCDVGGGTADFSLIAVTERGGELQLERISVGDHILLGGDNMDLALAYTLRAQLQQQGKELDAAQMLALVHGCRVAKEALFSDPAAARYPVTVPSRGASLFAKTITTHVTRELLQQVVVDGFLPLVSIADHPAVTQGGLQEMGLAYAQDPVLSRHLAQFLVRSCINVQSNEQLQKLARQRIRERDGVSFICPSAVLFNGGIFKAQPLRQRVFDLLRQFGGEEIRQLPGSDFDLAVARGAAVYTRLKAQGKGVRIKAGTAYSYYIGIESSMPAIPGFTPPLRAVCVVPQGMEEGSECSLDEREFALVTGQPVQFRFFSSAVRAGDEVGSWVEDAAELEETSTLTVTLPRDEGQDGTMVPVRLHSHITELGTLELWMQHTESAQRWKIEFNVREQ